MAQPEAGLAWEVLLDLSATRPGPLHLRLAALALLLRLPRLGPARYRVIGNTSEKARTPMTGMRTWRISSVA